MKGLDFTHVTPESMKQVGEAMIRRAEMMAQGGRERDILKKNLIPLIQRMKRERHELQLIIDQMIDKAAELEKTTTDADRLVSEILGKDSGMSA